MLEKTFREGFTLIELSLSMLFIGILSVSIVLIISNTVSSYRRGMTLTQINTMGVTLADDMRSSVQNASSRSLSSICDMSVATASMSTAERLKCESEGAYNYVSIKRTSNVKIRNGKQTLSNVPVFGVVCTGTYSYIWNSGYFEAEGVSFTERTNKAWAMLKYLDTNGNAKEVGRDKPFKLLKVQDNSRAVCIAAISDTGNKYSAGANGANNNVLDITKMGASAIVEEPTELLSTDNGNNLVLYDLRAARPAESLNNALYSISFILGTLNGGVNVISKGSACTAPSGYEDDNFNYCSINKFNFTAQVNGE